jgi:hypothetical protein
MHTQPKDHTCHCRTNFTNRLSRSGFACHRRIRKAKSCHGHTFMQGRHVIIRQLSRSKRATVVPEAQDVPDGRVRGLGGGREARRT